jgi:UDP-N-acetylglucosamine--N-acetylmuramyl-(pentapeptide) pyrophosphoryl-undecaprenol N-acetylglucosamine transferase
MRLLITGGGTGGHVYPLLAVLQHLVGDERAASRLDLRNEVHFIGRAGSMEERLARRAGISFSPIQVGGVRSLAPTTAASNLLRMLRAIGTSEKILREFQPGAILATGGYVSAPVIWGAARTRTPVIIYLPDLEPGWAIKTLWRWSKQVAVSFDEVLKFFPRGRATVTGYPVRAEFYEATREEARKHFELDATLPVVTVFGGSQGAHAINEAVRANLNALLDVTQLIHISGRNDEASLKELRATLDESRRSRYHLFSYLEDDMPQALAAADIVIARAGAATLGEFPAVGVPSILVPGKFAQGHQEKNADFLASRGAAIKLDEAGLMIELVSTISGLLGDRVRLDKMSQAARALAKPDAAKKIGELLFNVARTWASKNAQKIAG